MGDSGLLTPGRLRNLSLGHLVNQHLEIDENLAADFDGSFSGLGVDINASNYSMSDALMALPNLSISTSQIFKQEAISPAALAATVNAAGVVTYSLLIHCLIAFMKYEDCYDSKLCSKYV